MAALGFEPKFAVAVDRRCRNLEVEISCCGVDVFASASASDRECELLDAWVTRAVILRLVRRGNPEKVITLQGIETKPDAGDVLRRRKEIIGANDYIRKIYELLFLPGTSEMLPGPHFC